MRGALRDLPQSGVRSAAVVAATLALGALATACSGRSSGPGVANLGVTATRQASAGSPEASSRVAELQYAHCMRAHGIPDFPDPGPTGGFNLSDQPGSDLNPSDPALQAAAGACAKIRGFKGNSTPARQRQYTAELLRFARCVRADGVPNFPDPSSLGPNQGVGFLIDRNTLDPHSPALQAAVTACQRVVPVNPGFKSYG
jgi:hypothetical protein